MRFGIPATYRGRIALTIALVLLATVLGQALVSDVVGRRLQADLQKDLREQAQLIADNVNAAADPEKLASAQAAARYLVRTRIVVKWPAKPGLYYNVVPFERQDSEVAVRSGDVEVRMARENRGGGLSRWGLAGLLALATVLAIAVWLLAESLTRRLTRQAKALAGAASAVAGGDKTARAPESDDELGRVAQSFNHMARRLEEADERQRRLLADVAHELRNPVTAIQGFAGALTDGAAATAEDRAEAAEFIREEAERLHVLVSDLRNLTLLDLDTKVAIDQVDLAQAGDDALQRLRPLAHERGVLLADVTGSATVATDRSHLDTILGNLVSNALLATPAGGTVAITVGGGDGGPWIAVRDTGVGISPDDQQRIFDRLYRVDKARSRADGGSGLGLAIVQRLVTEIGASIVLQSEPGKGSTFTITFPPPATPPTSDEGTA